jgi:CheY-like chemotaxis protein
MALSRPSPLILCFIADLFFAVKVEDAAKRLGYQVEFIERTAQISTVEQPLPERQYAEHLVGPGAVLMEKISAWQPALIIVDLNNQQIPWQEWIALIKSAPATRRIPLICFGSHVDTKTIQAAKDRGADLVVARSRFTSALPELIQKYARIPDYEELDRDCRQELSQLALRGIEEFNRGEYFEAHETLEEAWNEDESAGRELYRAILQVAVAYLQIERQNYAGAVKMFLRVRQWIAPFPDRCRGVDVAALKTDAQRAYDHLVQLGAERVADFDRQLLRPVKID